MDVLLCAPMERSRQGRSGRAHSSAWLPRWGTAPSTGLATLRARALVEQVIPTDSSHQGRQPASATFLLCDLASAPCSLAGKTGQQR